MPRDILEAPEREAFVADVTAFAAILSSDAWAKMVGFFHLAQTDDPVTVDLFVDASGRVALHIEVQAHIQLN